MPCAGLLLLLRKFLAQGRHHLLGGGAHHRHLAGCVGGRGHGIAVGLHLADDVAEAFHAQAIERALEVVGRVAHSFPVGGG